MYAAIIKKSFFMMLTDYILLATYYWLHTTGYILLATYYWLHTTDYLLLTAGYVRHLVVIRCYYCMGSDWGHVDNRCVGRSHRWWNLHFKLIIEPFLGR